jgi:hypothetical protein
MDQITLQGRILAQQLLMRAIVTNTLMSNATDPLAALNQLRSDFRQTLQNAERNVGEEEDAIYEAGVASLFSELDAVENRVRAELKDRGAA